MYLSVGYQTQTFTGHRPLDNPSDMTQRK